MMTRPLPPHRPAIAAGVLAALAAGLAAAEPTPAAEAPTKAEAAGLARLHRTAVELFVDRPGFGVRRMALPLNDVLAPTAGSSDRGSGEGDPPQARPDTRGKPSHFAFRDLLARDKSEWVPSAEVGKGWAVRDVELIGVITHPKPVAYTGVGVPGGAAPGKRSGPEAGDGLKTRELDGFEAEAVKGFRDGKGLAAERRGSELRAVGPIYAGRRCAGCHGERGELLGAFSYRLELTPTVSRGSDRPSP